MPDTAKHTPGPKDGTMPDPTPRLAQSRSRSGRPKEPPTWEWIGLTREEVTIIRNALEYQAFTGNTLAERLADEIITHALQPIE